MDSKSVWETLSVIDVNEHCDKRGKFTYLSWSWAWATLMKHYPSANYSFEPPVFFADGSCEVWVTINVEDTERSMWLPVMDYNNKAVFNPNSRDISDTRMRCLTKCMAMFGLGHYIYAGDSMPQTEPENPYTDEQYETYHLFIEEMNSYRFFLLRHSLSDEAYDALIGTFPDGSKTLGRKKVRELEMQGAKDVLEVVDRVTEMVNNEDPAYAEELEGLEPYEKQVLASRFSDDTKKKMTQLSKGK